MCMRMVQALAVIFALSGAVLRAEEVDLCRIPGVEYSYVDANLNPVSPEKMKDPGRSILTDGVVGGKEAVASTYRYSLQKEIRVLFRFPVPVTVDRAEAVWRHAHDSRQWFDRVTLQAGADSGTLRPVAVAGTPESDRHATPVSIVPEKPVTARAFLFEMVQDVHPKHAMMTFDELKLFGSKAEAEKLKAAFDRKAEISIGRHYPGNLFRSGETVSFPITVRGLVKSEIRAELRDYFGNIVEKTELSAGPDGKGTVTFNALPDGYYVLTLEASGNTADGTSLSGTGKTGFIVAPLFERSRAEAFAAGNRFGVTFHHSTPESRLAPVRLGLSWGSFLLAWAPRDGEGPDRLDFTPELQNIRDFAVDLQANNFIQIKSAPPWCYDEKRFGPPGKDWALKMPTNKEAFQQFIREQVKLIPADQHFVKVWNEPWDIYTPEDYATLCDWIGEAVKQVRPDLQLGPNLGPMEFMSRFLDAGGMKHMDMLLVHPYSADFTSSPEAAGMRERIRAWKELLRRKTGRDYPVCVTEVGWPTPETGPNRNSEERQAYCLARAGLGLFAEDVRAVTFFCNGSPEKIKDYREDFFGVFRADGTPKPALAAIATMSRLLEGARFKGDLWLGPDIGALLFETKSGERMLALYSDGKEQKIFLRPDCRTLRQVDIAGNARTLDIKENRLSLTVDDNPVYLIGLGPEIEKLLVPADKVKWSNVYQRSSREAKYCAEPDDAFWRSAPVWDIVSSEIAPDHLSAHWQAAWNETTLFLRIDVTDRDPGVNGNEDADVWRGDAIELFLSSAPDNAIPGFLKEADHQILLTPFGKDGKSVAVSADLYHRGKALDAIGSKYTVRKNGYLAEIAIPFQSIDFKPGAGSRLGVELVVDDLCNDHKAQRRSISSNGRRDNHTNAALWSILTLNK